MKLSIGICTNSIWFSTTNSYRSYDSDHSRIHGASTILVVKASYMIKRWVRFGEYHRLDGPAYMKIFFNGIENVKVYFVNGLPVE